MSNLEKSLNEAFGLPNGMWVSPEGEIYPLRDTHAVDGYHIVKKLWPDVTMVDPPDSIEILIDQKWTRVTGPRIPVTHRRTHLSPPCLVAISRESIPAS